MQILQLFFKNSSTLDFTLPIFWHLKNKEISTQTTLFYWGLSKSEFFFHSPYSEKLFAELGIVELTLANFPKKNMGMIVRLMSRLSAFYRLPVTPTKDALFSFHLKSILENIFYKIFIRAKIFIETNLVDYEKLYDFLEYDVLFFDNRAEIKNLDYDKIFSWLDSKKAQVILCPHAPHYVRETEGFAPFIPNRVNITDYCQVWYTHKFSKPWIGNDEFRDQFKFSGYPGFDEKWVKYIKDNFEVVKNDSIFTVIIIGRKFYHKGVRKINSKEFVTMTYDEMKIYLNYLNQTLTKLLMSIGKKLHIIYKPHPSSDLALADDLLKEVGVESFEIFTDLLYFAIPKANLVISPYSTSLLIPCFFEIPVFLINSPLQEQVNSFWDKVKEMYTGLAYFCIDEEQFEIKISHYFKNINIKGIATQDRFHLLEYFPENSLNLIEKIILDNEKN